MKRIVSLVLALSMVLSLFTTAFAGTTLKDVEGTKYEAAVSALVELGVVNGYKDDTYRAENVITRAELAKLLVIASGLEGAADLNKGGTKFTDVASDHWATGFINVATQYGYVNGYPDGTFKPDDTVTYAEAVTMAIRVLGYKSVVESRGTWPTNYIAKATELKALKDINYVSYSDGAIRGDMAILIWNILRAPMWDVESESEKDGLNYGKNGTTMISKYFDDYDYIDEDSEYVVTSIDVADGKVTVDLESDKDGVKDLKEVELGKGTEFLNLLGRKISGLYNSKDEEMVVIAPSTDDTVKADYKSELEDDDYKLTSATKKVWGKTQAADGDNYMVAVIGKSKTADYVTEYRAANSYVVKEAKMSKDTLKITTVDDSTKKITKEEAIVLIDGDWATREDIKAGDVVTELIANELYVVNRKSISGSLKDAAADFVKVDGTKYEHLLTNKLYEMDSNDKKVANPTFESLDKDSKYFDEDCTLYVNFLGEVVRVEFEEIKDQDDGNFYVLTNVPASWEASDKSGVTRYVELNNEDYEVKTSAEALDGFDYETLVPGSVVFVKFDKKDRVTDIEVVAKVVENDIQIVAAGAKADDYNFVEGTSELDNNYIGNYKISNSTSVYTITAVEDEDDDIVGYEVEITKGQSALKGIENTLLAHKDGSKVAAYGFVWEDAKSTDVEYGIIDEKGVQSGKKVREVTIDGKTYTIDEDETTELTKADEGKVIAFVENDDGITIKRLYSVDDMEAVLANRIKLDEEDTSRMFTFGDNPDDSVDLDNEDLEDTTFVVITYDPDEEEFSSVDVRTADSVEVDDDYIYDNTITEIKDVIFIIKGYEFPKSETDPDTDPVVTKYTITFKDGNGEDLEVVEVVENEVPATTKVPTKAESDTETYTFDGWAKTEGGDKLDTLPVATEDATYYPLFIATSKAS